MRLLLPVLLCATTVGCTAPTTAADPSGTSADVTANDFGLRTCRSAIILTAEPAHPVMFDQTSGQVPANTGLRLIESMSLKADPNPFLPDPGTWEFHHVYYGDNAQGWIPAGATASTNDECPAPTTLTRPASVYDILPDPNDDSNVDASSYYNTLPTGAPVTTIYRAAIPGDLWDAVLFDGDYGPTVKWMLTGD